MVSIVDLVRPRAAFDPRQSGRPAPPDRGGGGFHLLCDDLIHWQRCGSSVRLLRCITNDARRKAGNLMRVERSAGENRGRKSRRAAAIKPFNNPTGCVFAPRFLHPFRDEKTQQGQRNQPPPAERTAGLDRDAQHFRIDQRPCPLNPRSPLHDSPLAGPIARKGGCSCTDDGNQQEHAGHCETAENGAKVDR